MIERVSLAPAGEDLEAQLAAERPRLVGLCARLSGDAAVAEDLAQETLAEAWRLLAKLRQPEGLASWLNAIARNICLRWVREVEAEGAHALWTGFESVDSGARLVVISDLQTYRVLSVQNEGGEA